jgi:glycosyltransferase involved in cell wall biosynthesis
MRILHLTHTDIRFDNRILKELEALSILPDNQLFAIGLIKDEGAAINNTKILNTKIKHVDSIFRNIRIIPNTLKHLLIFIEFFLKIFIFSLKIRPKIIHCHDTLVLPIGFFLKFIFKSKLVYDAHELESNKNGQTKLFSIITIIIERICWSRINLLISVSPSIINWYSNKFGLKKSTLILNSPKIISYPQHEKLINNNKYFHKKYNINNDKIIFIYIGALVKGRGIELLLNVFKDPLIKSHIVFMGFGELQNLVFENEKLSHNIHYHESVSHDMITNLVQNADYGLCVLENVSLSDYFCLPNKLFEYAFSGLPVLASDFPDIKNLVHQYNLGICCSFNIKDVKDTIMRLQNNPIYKISSDLNSLSWEEQAKKLRIAYIELN